MKQGAMGTVPVWLGVAFAMLSGCAKPRGEFFAAPTERVVWPNAPERPRVEYLGQFSGAIRAVSTATMGASMRKLLFGDEEPLPHLVTPHAVAVDPASRRLAIADSNARCVHLLDLEAKSYEAIRVLDANPPVLRCPVGVAWLGDVLFVADAEEKAIAAIAAGAPRGAGNASTRKADWFGHGELVRPGGLAANAETGRVYVCDAGGHSVVVLDVEGRLLFRFGVRGAGPGQLNFPTNLSATPEGDLLVSDTLNFRIQRFTSEGEFMSSFGRKGDAAGDFALPKGLSVDADGNIWVVDSQFENVQGFDPTGILLLAFGEEGQGPGQFWLPAGAAIDSKNRLWVADTYNRRVQAFQLLR
jgi:sugar lactone lactonase YvrE